MNECFYLTSYFVTQGNFDTTNIFILADCCYLFAWTAENIMNQNVCIDSRFNDICCRKISGQVETNLYHLRSSWNLTIHRENRRNEIFDHFFCCPFSVFYKGQIYRQLLYHICYDFVLKPDVALTIYMNRRKVSNHFKVL